MSFPSKHKAKILVFSPWYPPHIGGLENHAEQFNNELVARGYEIMVITPEGSAGGQAREKVSPSLTILRFPSFEPIPKFPVPAWWRPEWRAQWRTARQFAPAVVVSRTRFFSTTAIAYWYHRVTHTPWLHIEHGSDYVQFNHWLARQAAVWYDHLISRWLLRRATALVANSEASARFTQRLSDRSDVQRIYRGVQHADLASIPPAPRPPHLIDKVLLIYTGRLIEGKGVPVLLRALAQLTSHPIHCYIIGNGPQAKRLHTLAEELRVTPQITFFSHLPWGETIAYLKSADICVNPSYSEGLPTSLIEAALCGTTIVASDVGGTDEVITNNASGLLVPARDFEALAAALESLITNPPLRQRLASTAATAVGQKFKWGESIDAYERLFATLPQT